MATGLPWSFLRRDRSAHCIVEAGPTGVLFLLGWAPGLILAGLAMSGPRFFTAEYWLTQHGPFIPAWIGIPVLAAGLIWSLYTALDHLLGWPCYVGIAGPSLVINGRTAIALSEIHGVGLSQDALFVELKRRNGLSPVRLPAIFSRSTAPDIQRRIELALAAHSGLTDQLSR